jgi:hypothetical protein
VKRCFKCFEEKPLSEFYRHAMMADGHLSKCKTCARQDVLDNRLKKTEQYREYDRERSALPHRRALRERIAAEWAEKHPDRRRAINAANNAVRDGVLVRADRCEGCGCVGGVQKHHPDYAQPLLVMWLCKPCHAIADKIRRHLEGSASSCA